MESSGVLLTVCFLVIYFTTPQTEGAWSLDDFWPEMQGIQFGGYQTHVEVKLLNKTLFVDEFHNVEMGKGVLKTEEISVYYYSQLNQSVVINGSKCDVYNEASALDHTELDWLWLDREHSILGFSAVLWRKFKNLKHSGKETVRNIACEKFIASDEATDTEIEYYFAASEWHLAHGLNLTFPVQVLLRGKNSNDIQFDFTFWDPYPPSQYAFNIPVGIGCLGLKSSKPPSLSLPEEQYSFVIENYNELQRGEKKESNINLVKMWYDEMSQLVRVDGSYNASGQFKPYREVLDFATGVTYTIYDGGKCFMKAINNSFALTNTELKSLKSPKEILNLDLENIYYIGKDVQRGIDCDVWESVKYNYVTTQRHKVDKAVFTFYYSSPNVKELAEGDEITQVPVSVVVTVYKNGTDKAIARVTSNMFKFDQADFRPFHQYMSVEECFTQETARLFFLINFPAKNGSIQTAKANKRLLEQTLVETIARNAGARPFRIPFLEVFYQEDNFQVLGLLVGRPSYITGFILDSRTPKSKYSIEILDLGNSGSDETCARTCIDYTLFTCRSFKLCKMMMECTVSNKAFDFVGADLTDCAIYQRAVEPTIHKDTDLDDSSRLLKDSLTNGKLIIEIGDKTNGKFIASNISFSPRPFNHDDNEIMYEGVFNDFQVSDKSKYSYVARSGLSNALECYKNCVDETAIFCASFSFCTTQKTCILNSLYMKTDDEMSKKHIAQATSCDVFRKKDLQFFTLNEGIVPQLPGYNTLINVQTDEECSTYCRSDENCKSFEFCAKPENCILHEIHELEISKPANEDLLCRHYSLRYITDYDVLGDNLTLVDPEQLTLDGLTLEKCAGICSEKVNRFDCKSFNYCPGAESDVSKSQCQLNKLSNAFEGQTVRKPGCQHYFSE